MEEINLNIIVDSYVKCPECHRRIKFELDEENIIACHCGWHIEQKVFIHTEDVAKGLIENKYKESEQ
jgi:ribosomal protein L37AE/L43A